MKKWMLIVIIAILFVATILLAIFFNTPKVVAADTVDMEYFNKIVEELNTKINTTQEQITALENKNNVLEQRITTLNTKVKSLEQEVDNNYSSLTNRVFKIETREDKLYDLHSKGYPSISIGYTMIRYKNA